MIRTIRTAAAACAIIAVGAAMPAAAKRTVTVQAAATVAANAACTRKLESVQCGRYQDRVLLIEARRAGKRSDAAGVRALGRNQLDALIDSVS